MLRRLLRVLALARILNRSAASSLVGKVFMYVAGAAVTAKRIGASEPVDSQSESAAEREDRS